MTHFDKILAFVAFVLVSSNPPAAFCEEAPRSGRFDVRVRELSYRPDEVVSVNGSYGVSTAIVLGDDEKIEPLALVDSVAWKVEQN